MTTVEQNVMEVMSRLSESNLLSSLGHLAINEEASGEGSPTLPSTASHDVSDFLPGVPEHFTSSGENSVSEHTLEPALLDSLLQQQQGLSNSPQLGSKNDTGRPSQDCAKAQICFDFTKGLCTRGDKCKYSHDLATIVHFNSKEKGICFDYLRNQCHRGLLCRFSHDLSNIAQQCQVYHGPASRGRTNAICYDFVKGVCQRGNDCRYSHDLSLIARTARGGSQSLKSGEICYDYLRGRCNRGTSCKYSHNISFLATPNLLGGVGSSPDQATMSAMASAGNGGSGLSVPLAALSSALPPELVKGGGMSSSLNSDMNDTLTGHTDQPPAPMWSGLPMPGAGMQNQAHANSQAAILNSLAQQQRQFAANLSNFSQIQQAVQAAQMASGAPSADQMKNAAVATANNGYSQQQTAASARSLMPGSQQSDQGNNGVYAAAVAAAAQGANSMQQMMRTASAPADLPLPNGVVTPETISTIFANLPNNPQLLAETLNHLAAAAQAQAQAQVAHAQAMRMSAPGTGPSSAPQPIPGRYEHSSSPNMSFSENLHSGGSMPSAEHLTRAAAAAGMLQNGIHPGMSSDCLLPLLKEIWNK